MLADAHLMRPFLPLLFAATLSACGLAESQAAAIPGSPVKRCVNMGNTLEAPVEGEWGHIATRRDIDRMAELGFDTLRLPVAWSEHLDGSGRIDPAFLARVDEVVGWAERRGLNVIINVHHFRELEEDADAHIPTLLGIWEQLSRHYRLAGDRVIFEVVNEPNGDFTVDLVNAVNRDALRIIRDSNPGRWVILGSGQWGTVTPFLPDADPAFEPVSDPRTIATFHSYAPYEFTHQGIAFSDDPPPAGRALSLRDRREVELDLEGGAAFSASSGMPVLLGEFGTYRGIPHHERLQWTRWMREGAEARGLGWCVWDWSGEFPIYEAETDTVLPGMADALGLRAPGP